MITESTVFIIGAGASVPYGYPTGGDLRKQIIQVFPKIVGQHVFSRSTLDIERDKNLLEVKSEKLADEFDKSDTQSIDLFLYRRGSEFSDIGKRAIVTCIYLSEKDSRFREMASQGNWYTHLFDTMGAGLSKPDDFLRFKDNKVSFITFNYDRSLEHYLYTSFMHSFDPDRLKTHKPIDLIPFPFEHVYGCIAPLPWQDDNGLKYRGFHLKTRISELLDNIHIIHERTIDNIESIKNLISTAHRIFFLGFGFADENLKALGFPDVLYFKHNIYGTTMGLSNQRVEKIRILLSSSINIDSKDRNRFNNHKIKFENKDCLSFLQEYL